LFKEAPPSPLYGLLTIYIDNISAREFPFLQNLPAFIVCGLFDKGHFDQCEVIPHCSFDLHFYTILVCGGFSYDLKKITTKQCKTDLWRLPSCRLPSFEFFFQDLLEDICWGQVFFSLHSRRPGENKCPSESESRSVVSDSLRPHGLYSPWNSPGQNTGVGSCPLLQGIFPTQGSNPGLPRSRWISVPRAEVFSVADTKVARRGSISPCSSCGFCFGLEFIFYWSRVDFRCCVCFRYRNLVLVYMNIYLFWREEVFSHIGSFSVFNWRRQWHPTPVLLPGKSMDRGAW